MQHRFTKTGRIDGRVFNGGARKGAGRPRAEINPICLNFALEEIVVREFRHGQIRRVKKTRLIAAFEKLFEIGMRGGKDGNGDVKAISLWLDYAVGKPERVRIHRNTRDFRRDRYYSPKTLGDLHVEELIGSIYEANEQIAGGKFFPKASQVS